MKHHGTLVTQCDDIGAPCGDVGAATLAITRSYWQYQRGVFGDIRVGVTPQMCNKVTNHRDMDTFSRPGLMEKGNSILGANRLNLHPKT